MEEGLLQILFILFFIVAAIFDAVARSRGKGRRVEEMEAEDGTQDVEATAEADRADPEGAKRRRAERAEARWERMEQERRDRRKAHRDSEPVGQGRGEAETEPERQTADSMVPEDFWAILTGQTPPSSRPEPEMEHHEMEPQLEAEEASMPERESPREPRIQGPPVETRRSSRWMEGVGGREDSSRWTEGVEEEEKKRVYTLPPEPWEALEDITAGEISDGRGRVQESVEGTAGAGAEGRQQRRGSGRGTYTRLLETGEIEDLRKAIVLREVLGGPVGFRERERDWNIG